MLWLVAAHHGLTRQLGRALVNGRPGQAEPSGVASHRRVRVGGAIEGPLDADQPSIAGLGDQREVFAGFALATDSRLTSLSDSYKRIVANGKLQDLPVPRSAAYADGGTVPERPLGKKSSWEIPGEKEREKI